MKYLIWGTGMLAKELYDANYVNRRNDYLPDIVGFIDNEKEGEFYGKRIYSPNDIFSIEYDYIDIWVLHKRVDIEKQIADMKLPKGIIRNFLEDSIYQIQNYAKKNEKYCKPTQEQLELVSDYYRCQPWYKYAYREFENRKHCYNLYNWITKNVNKDASILEIACGAGGMLYRLCEDGFINLFGYDYSDRAINTATKLNEITRGIIQFGVDNAYNPQHDIKHDVLVWTNGMYHLDDYSLEMFFDSHIKLLNNDGFVLFDMIDEEYNNRENNQYRLDCWDKEEKFPSEYKIRMSDEQVVKAAEKKGLKLIEKYKMDERVPHNAYVFQK